MDNKTKATWVNWISGLFIATIAFSAGASHFSNLYNAPPSSSPYFQTCPNSSDPTGCEEAEFPLYETTHQQEEHWMTVLIVLAGISGLLCFSTLVAFMSESRESAKRKRSENVAQSVNEIDLANAYQLVKREKRVSTSLLQRELHIGYGEAARLMEAMEERKMIGPADGAMPREIYE